MGAWWGTPQAVSDASEPGSRERRSLIRPQAEGVFNQGKISFLTRPVAWAGFPMFHSIQKWLIRHLLCARLELAQHFQGPGSITGSPEPRKPQSLAQRGKGLYRGA